MSTNMSNSAFIKSLKSDLQKYSHTVASELAHTMSDELKKEYEYCIDVF